MRKVQLIQYIATSIEKRQIEIDKQEIQRKIRNLKKEIEMDIKNKKTGHDQGTHEKRRKRADFFSARPTPPPGGVGEGGPLAIAFIPNENKSSRLQVINY